MDERLERLEREVGRLRGEALRDGAGGAYPAIVASDGRRPTTESPRRAAVPDLEPTEIEARARMRHELLKQALQSEARDPAWAQPTEARLRHLFSDPVMKSAALAGIECRSTLCNVEATVASEQQIDAYQRGFLDLVSEMLPRLKFRLEPDGVGGFRVARSEPSPGRALAKVGE